MARKIKERKLKNPTITIIGEGATERYYFTHLKRLCGYNDVSASPEILWNRLLMRCGNR